MVLLTLLAGPVGAAGVTATWNGGAGNWNDSAQWSLVPSIGATVPNNGADTFDVLIDDTNLLASEVTLNQDVTIDSLLISVGDRLIFADERDLTLNTALVNDGVLQLNHTPGGFYATDLRINGTVAYSGTGVLEASASTSNRLRGAGVGDVLQAANPLMLQSGILSIDSLTIENAELHAGDGATIRLGAGTTVSGGIITASGTGEVRNQSTGVVLDGVTVQALEIPDEKDLTVRSSLAIDGTLHLSHTVGGFYSTDIFLDGPVVFDGGAGVIDTTDTYSNRIAGLPGSSLRIVGDLAIVDGKVTISDTPIDNEAGIVATNAGIRLQNSSIDNAAGHIEARGGSTIQLGTGLEILGGRLAGDPTSVIESIADTPRLDAVELAAGTLLRINDEKSIRVSSSLTNHGEVFINHTPGGFYSTDLVIDGPVTYSGLGQLGASASSANVLRGENTAQLTLLDELRLGAGQLTMRDMAVVNQAAVVADGATLRVRDVTFDNGAGSLWAEAGGVVELGTGVVVRGGVLRADANSAFHVIADTPELDATTIHSGTIVSIRDEASVRLKTSLHNDGMVHLDHTPGGFYQTDLLIDGPVNYSGAGTIGLSDTVSNRLLGAGGPDDRLIASAPLVFASTPGGVGRVTIRDLTVENTELRASDATTVRLGSGSVIRGGIVGATGSGEVRSASGSAVIEDVTVEDLLVPDEVDLTVRGTLAISGALRLEHSVGGFYTTDLQLDGPVEFTGGGGHIAPSATTSNRIQGLPGSSLLISGDLVAQGGMLTLTEVPTTNQARLVADGATLRLRSVAIENQGTGAIETRTGGVVRLDVGTEIVGGTLANDGTGGEFESVADSPVLDGVTLGSGATLRITDEASVTLRNVFTNEGTVHVDHSVGGFYTTDVFLDGAVTYRGTGTMRGSAIHRNRIGRTGGDLTIEGNLVVDQGEVEIHADSTDNQGTLGVLDGARLALVDAAKVTNVAGGTLTGGTWSASGAGSRLELLGAAITDNAATVRLSGLGSRFDAIAPLLTNTAAGSLSILDGHQFVAAGPTLTNHGRVEVHGPGAELAVPSLANELGAILLGDGTIDGSVMNAGSILAGGENLAGALTVTGDLGLDASSVLSIDLASLLDFDTLVAGADATLGGKVEVNFLDHYRPEVGDSFEILSAASVLGSFSSGSVMAEGFGFDILVNPTTVLLSVTASPVPVPPAFGMFAAAAGMVAWWRRRRPMR